MEEKVERLIYLLEELGRQAEGRLALLPHIGGTGYKVLGRLFNDYLRQLREAAGEGMVSTLEEVGIPDDERGSGQMAAEIALRARQIAAELRFQDWRTAADDQEGREDWADALVRLSEAGVDTDDLIQCTDILASGRGVDRAFVDRIIKLANAGIDVDDLLQNLAHNRPPRGLLHGHFRGPRPPRPPHMPRAARFPHGGYIEVEALGDSRRVRGSRDGEPGVSPVTPVSVDEGRTWRVDVLSRVEKGEITPEEAVELLRQGE